jgi:hypothetical protein
MLAVSNECVFFLNADAGEVLALPAAGGKPLAIATNLPRLTSLAMDDGHAWVTTAQGDVMSIEEGSGRVQRRRHAGTPALGVALDAKSFYWIENSATDGSVRTALK